jgi:hypothetical protein
LTELDADALPTFAMIVPDLCNDGHDCDNERVDAWLREHLQPLLTSDTYAAGRTAVFVLYDEDAPVPNLVVAPTAHRVAPGAAGSHRSALRTFEELLGLPMLPSVDDAPSLRSSSGV